MLPLFTSNFNSISFYSCIKTYIRTCIHKINDHYIASCSLYCQHISYKWENQRKWTHVFNSNEEKKDFCFSFYYLFSFSCIAVVIVVVVLFSVETCVAMKTFFVTHDYAMVYKFLGNVCHR